MSEHYHDPSDVRLLKEMRKLAPVAESIAGKIY